ncbi:MAG: helix-turn-helix domain-containing protein [Clostridiales bacterium]|nr:helix-turn-helix domain-containing protein [Clostridiales bacterium]
MTIGEKIKEIRKQKHISQKQLAEKLGISYVMISQYETGSRNPKINTINKIAAALDVDPSELLNSEEKTIQNQNEQGSNSILKLSPTIENIQKYPEYFDLVKDSIIKAINKTLIRIEPETGKKLEVNEEFYDNLSVEIKAELLNNFIRFIIIDEDKNELIIYTKLPTENYE